MLTFDFKRFLILLKKDFTENIRVVLITISIALFIALVLIIIEIINNPISIIHLNISFEIYYYIGLIVIGTGIAGFSFPAFRKTEKAINYLAMPASTLEKYLSFWLLSSLVFFLLYSIMFIVLNYLTIFIFNISYPNNQQIFFTLHEEGYIIVFRVYTNLNAIFLLGAISFKKTPPFFTTLIASTSALGIFVIISIFMHFLNGYSYRFDVPFSIESPLFIMYKNNFANEILNHLLLYGFAIFLWYVGYLKLKEKEV